MFKNGRSGSVLRVKFSVTLNLWSVTAILIRKFSNKAKGNIYSLFLRYSCPSSPKSISVATLRPQKQSILHVLY